MPHPSQLWPSGFLSFHLGCPKKATHEENVAAVKAAVDANGRMTSEELEEILRINAVSILRILKENLDYANRSAGRVPHLLSDEQKSSRVNSAKFFLGKCKNGKSSNFKLIVTGDETLLCNCDPETKRQSIVRLRKGAPPPQKVRCMRFVDRTVFAFFFSHWNCECCSSCNEEDCRLCVICDRMSSGSFDSIRTGRPQKLWRFVLYHDNASAHASQRTLDFIEDSGIQVLTLPSYSLDFAPCDFWLFPTMKKGFEGKCLGREKN